jgi:hypothetical protein
MLSQGGGTIANTPDIASPLRKACKQEAAMFLLKSDIFKDLRQEAVNDISEIAFEEAHEAGSTLFTTGDPADHFYILVEGRVQIKIGKTNCKEYVVGQSGRRVRMVQCCR